MFKAKPYSIILVMILAITAVLGGIRLGPMGKVTETAPDPPVQAAPVPKPEPVKLAAYQGPVYHIFFHSLIAFPEIAYSPTGGKGALDRDCITVSEYRRTLEQLYQNGYVLINIHNLYEVVTENGITMVKDKPLLLPEGKKPLVMSIDDMVYDPKKMGDGMVDKIILDERGQLATYTRRPNGDELVAYDNDIIPILEGFVKEHPDFSFQGAKATLALTGWVGVLGYRIQADSPTRDSEIAAVKPVIAKLKQSGWSFASHGYGHYDANKLTAARFAKDVVKWQAEIEPVVGPTDIYVYPYGATVPVNSDHYQVLLTHGFRLMCGVGMRPYWKNYGHSILMDRQVVDGYSLRYHQKLLAPLLDTTVVFDPIGRMVK